MPLDILNELDAATTPAAPVAENALNTTVDSSAKLHENMGDVLSDFRQYAREASSAARESLTLDRALREIGKNSGVQSFNATLRQSVGLISMAARAFREMNRGQGQPPAVQGVVPSGNASQFSSIPRYERGGRITGPYSTGDRQLARVNDGEWVFNARQMENLRRQLGASSAASVFRMAGGTPAIVRTDRYGFRMFGEGGLNDRQKRQLRSQMVQPTSFGTEEVQQRLLGGEINQFRQIKSRSVRKRAVLQEASSLESTLSQLPTSFANRISTRAGAEMNNAGVALNAALKNGNYRGVDEHTRELARLGNIASNFKEALSAQDELMDRLDKFPREILNSLDAFNQLSEGLNHLNDATTNFDFDAAAQSAQDARNALDALSTNLDAFAEAKAQEEVNRQSSRIESRYSDEGQRNVARQLVRHSTEAQYQTGEKKETSEAHVQLLKSMLAYMQRDSRTMTQAERNQRDQLLNQAHSAQTLEQIKEADEAIRDAQTAEGAAKEVGAGDLFSQKFGRGAIAKKQEEIKQTAFGGKDPTKGAVAAYFGAQAIKGINDFLEKNGQAIMSLAKLEVAAQHTKAAMDSAFGAKVYDQFRQSMNLTRQEMEQMAPVIMRAWRETGVELDKISEVAGNIKNQFGELDPETFREALDVMGQLTDAQVGVLTGANINADDRAGLYANLAKSGKIGEAADLLAKGAFGETEESAEAAEMTKGEREMVSHMKAFEKTSEDIKEGLLKFTAPFLKMALPAQKVVSFFLPAIELTLQTMAAKQMFSAAKDGVSNAGNWMGRLKSLFGGGAATTGGGGAAAGTGAAGAGAGAGSAGVGTAAGGLGAAGTLGLAAIAAAGIYLSYKQYQQYKGGQEKARNRILDRSQYNYNNIGFASDGVTMSLNSEIFKNGNDADRVVAMQGKPNIPVVSAVDPGEMQLQVQQRNQAMLEAMTEEAQTAKQTSESIESGKLSEDVSAESLEKAFGHLNNGGFTINNEQGKIDVETLNFYLGVGKKLEEFKDQLVEQNLTGKSMRQSLLLSLRALDSVERRLKKISTGQYTANYDQAVEAARKSIEIQEQTGGTSTQYSMNMEEIMKNSARSYKKSMQEIIVANKRTLESEDMDEQAKAQALRDSLETQAQITKKFVEDMLRSIGQYRKIPSVIQAELKSGISNIFTQNATRGLYGTTSSGVEMQGKALKETAEGLADSAKQMNEEMQRIDENYEDNKETRKQQIESIKGLNPGIKGFEVEGMIDASGKVNEEVFQKNRQVLQAEQESIDKGMAQRMGYSVSDYKQIQGLADRVQEGQEEWNKITTDFRKYNGKYKRHEKQELIRRVYAQYEEDLKANEEAIASGKLNDENKAAAQESVNQIKKQMKYLKDEKGIFDAEYNPSDEDFKKFMSSNLSMSALAGADFLLDWKKKRNEAIVGREEGGPSFQDRINSVEEGKRALKATQGLIDPEAIKNRGYSEIVKGFDQEQQKFQNSVEGILKQMENGPTVSYYRNLIESSGSTMQSQIEAAKGYVDAMKDAAQQIGEKVLEATAAYEKQIDEIKKKPMSEELKAYVEAAEKLANARLEVMRSPNDQSKKAAVEEAEKNANAARNNLKSDNDKLQAESLNTIINATVGAAAQSVETQRKNITKAVLQEYQIRKQAIDYEERSIQNQLTLMESIGGPVEKIVDLERQRVRMAQNQYEAAKKTVEELERIGSLGKEYEEAKLALQEASIKRTQLAYGAQNSMLEKMLGKMIGQFGEVAGMGAWGNRAALFGSGYMESGNGMAFQNLGGRPTGYRERVANANAGIGSYAEGGVVKGRHTSGDLELIRVNADESVLNKKQSQRLMGFLGVDNMNDAFTLLSSDAKIARAEEGKAGDVEGGGTQSEAMKAYLEQRARREQLDAQYEKEKEEVERKRRALPIYQKRAISPLAGQKEKDELDAARTAFIEQKKKADEIHDNAVRAWVDEENLKKKIEKEEWEAYKKKETERLKQEEDKASEEFRDATHSFDALQKNGPSRDSIEARKNKEKTGKVFLKAKNARDDFENENSANNRQRRERAKQLGYEGGDSATEGAAKNGNQPASASPGNPEKAPENPKEEQKEDKPSSAGQEMDYEKQRKTERIEYLARGRAANSAAVQEIQRNDFETQKEYEDAYRKAEDEETKRIIDSGEGEELYIKDLQKKAAKGDARAQGRLNSEKASLEQKASSPKDQNTSKKGEKGLSPERRKNSGLGKLADSSRDLDDYAEKLAKFNVAGNGEKYESEEKRKEAELKEKNRLLESGEAAKYWDKYRDTEKQKELADSKDAYSVNSANSRAVSSPRASASADSRTGAVSSPASASRTSRPPAAAQSGELPGMLKDFGHQQSSGGGGGGGGIAQTSSPSVSVNGKTINSSHIDLKVTVGFDQQYNLTAMVKDAIGVSS